MTCECCAFCAFEQGSSPGGEHIVRLASRVRRHEVPPIELRLWSGAQPLTGFWGSGGRSPPENFQVFMLIFDPGAPVNGIVTKSQTAIQGV